MTPFELPPATGIGHVHLRVSNLDASLAFYREVIGFTLTADGRPAGVPAVFLAAGEYHHHLALNTFEGPGLTPPPAGHTGLFHLAVVLPDRQALVRAVAHVASSGWTLDGARDHGATVSVYLRDPDQNGIELYYDRPRREWFDASGRPVLKNEIIPVRALVDEGLHAGTPASDAPDALAAAASC